MAENKLKMFNNDFALFTALRVMLTENLCKFSLSHRIHNKKP